MTSRRVRPQELEFHTGIKAPRWAKMRRDGTGPSYLKVGRIVLYDRDEVEAWLAQHRRQSTKTL